MAEDAREGRSVVSNSLTLPSGATEPDTVLPIRDEETVSVQYLRIQYVGSASVEETLTLYNEQEGTGSAELGDDVDQFFVTAGDHIVIEEPTYEDITDGLIVEPNGDGDGQIVVTVGGVKVTG